MDLRTHFQMVDNVGFGSPREYVDFKSKSHKSLNIKHKKRTSFFEDLQKISKNVPGPGKYLINPEDQKLHKKINQKLNFNELAKHPKDTYIDAVIKSKKSVPGVGKYDVVVDRSQQMKIKYKALGDRTRKEAPLFKQTIFDYVHVDNLNVDPGTYELVKPFGEKKSFRTDLEASHEEKGLKEKGVTSRSMSLPKLPTPQTYHPLEQGTFDKLKSHDSSHSFVKMSTDERFKKYGSIGPGPKYSLIAEWSPKSRYNPAKNMFKSTSTLRQPGVYH